MLRIFFFLITVLILSSGDVVADDPALTPISVLVEKAKKAIAQNDLERSGQLINEIYEMTTGLDAKEEIPIKDLATLDIQIRLCPYRQAMAPLHTTQVLERLHHQMRIVAFGIVKDKEENAPNVRAIIDCVQDNGEPVPEAKALRDGLVWAKKLHAANIEEVRAMGREYEALVERYPEDLFYDILNKSIDDKISKIRKEEERQEWKKRYPKGIGFQARLVVKAGKGDLAAQLEVAHRLETGNKFPQDNAMAYFWYKRARQNDGGEAAQTGMDRLFPHLSEFDFWLIDMWIEEGIRPY